MPYTTYSLDTILENEHFPALTVQELLGLTAKAIGIKIAWGMIPGDKPFICGLKKSAEPTYWNPIIDDEDARRLGTKLETLFRLGIVSREDFRERHQRLLDSNVDGASATRLAIVLTVVSMQMALDNYRMRQHLIHDKKWHNKEWSGPLGLPYA